MITTKAENKSGRKPIHGHSSINGRKKASKTYTTWKMMKERCTNPKNNSFYRYGEIGIGVCDRWFESFNDFLEDMGIRTENNTLDRIDNTKGYYKENCKWSTPSEQQNNRKDTVVFTKNGETLSIPNWCKKLNIDRHIVHTRIYRGWSAEKAIFHPLRKYQKS